MSDFEVTVFGLINVAYGAQLGFLFCGLRFKLSKDRRFLALQLKIMTVALLATVVGILVITPLVAAALIVQLIQMGMRVNEYSKLKEVKP